MAFAEGSYYSSTDSFLAALPRVALSTGATIPRPQSPVNAFDYIGTTDFPQNWAFSGGIGHSRFGAFTLGEVTFYGRTFNDSLTETYLIQGASWAPPQPNVLILGGRYSLTIQLPNEIQGIIFNVRTSDTTPLPVQIQTRASSQGPWVTEVSGLVLPGIGQDKIVGLLNPNGIKEVRVLSGSTALTGFIGIWNVALVGRHFMQSDIRWSGEKYLDKRNKNTVRAVGCHLTSLANAGVRYGLTNSSEGNPINPGSLNAFLSNPSNHSSSATGFDFYPNEVSKYFPHDLTYLRNIAWIKAESRSNPWDISLPSGSAIKDIVKGYLAAGYQVIAEVRSISRPNDPKSAHFVLVTGTSVEPLFSGGTSLVESLSIQDPASVQTGSLRVQYRSLNNNLYRNQVQSFRIWAPNSQLGNTVTFSMHSPAEILFTDTQGLRAGVDPRTGQVFSEIPNSSYDVIASIADPEGDQAEPGYTALTLQDANVNGTVELIGTGLGEYGFGISGASSTGQTGGRLRIDSISDLDVHTAVITTPANQPQYSSAQFSNSGEVRLHLVAASWGQGTLPPASLEIVNAAGKAIRTYELPFETGNYLTLADIPIGSCTLIYRSKYQLSKVIPIEIHHAGETVHVEMESTLGDIDGDDIVSIFDYLILSNYFDTSSSDQNWLSKDQDGFCPHDADIDGDGAITIFDYLILSDEFDKVGDASF
ncbi:MAG: dockerin type I repeat-containing protein [Armatimonadetes bacterium]|nr:dockerin type I repeat-containing protein [Armatimonadota bacterium]